MVFLEGDGEKLTELLGDESCGTFDAVWISEALSHFPDKHAFWRGAHAMLKPGGKLVVADWFRADHLGSHLTDTVIADIERSMLLPRLDEVSAYIAGLTAAGCRLVYMEDVSAETARTWDICLELVAKPALWAMAWKLGSDFIAFLRSFVSMREGFRTGAFRYALLVAEKPMAAQLTAK